MVTTVRNQSFRELAIILGAIAFFAVLVLTSLYSYLLFHTLAELISIVIAGTLFVLVWNFRRFYTDSFLIFIGTAFLFCSLIDLIHTLAYKGMAIFQGYDANLPTQLWIGARYLQSAALLVAPFFLRRRVKMRWMASGLLVVTLLLLLSIFVWPIFPTSYIEGVGLTPFKITSEYIIDLILLIAIALLLLNRRSLDRKVLQWMVLSIAFTMISELAFTFYVSVYGISNLLGHIAKIVAFFLFYKALIETEAGVIYTDMTQLRQTEKALRASEFQAQRSLAELQSIYANTPVGLCFFNTELRFQAINDTLANIIGLPAGAHIGKTLPEVLLAQTVEVIEPWLRQVLDTHQPALNRELNGTVDPKSGRSPCWLVSLHPVFGKDGAMLGVSCVVQDVTEQRRAENELEEYAARLKRSNQDLEEFAFVASHDLQEPLRKIKMFGSQLERQLGEASSNGNSAGIPAGSLDTLQRMQNAAGRMQVMIDGLLELSRINTRGGSFEPAELRPIVEDVINDLDARIQSTGGQIIVDDLYSAVVDIQQIHRLFQNLIGNGLKFHKPDVPPLIEVMGRINRSRAGSTITISVKDNGIGFDEQYAQRIFQPFQRLHGRSEYEGTGLGLSIAQKIVERHRGRIEAHSRPGEGSVFQITLPIQDSNNDA